LAGLEYVKYSDCAYEMQLIIRLVNAANALDPKPKIALPKGDPSLAKSYDGLIHYDNKKGIKILGIKYKTVDETTGDIIRDFEQRGWY
jgi:hypothetical protein